MEAQKCYNIDLNITDNCNFKCSYCIEGCGPQVRRSENISDDMINNFKTFIYKLKNSSMFKKRFNCIMIAFWGRWTHIKIW